MKRNGSRADPPRNPRNPRNARNLPSEGPLEISPDVSAEHPTEHRPEHHTENRPENRRSVRLAGGNKLIDAVVVDRYDQPIELVPETRVLNVSAGFSDDQRSAGPSRGAVEDRHRRGIPLP